MTDVADTLRRLAEEEADRARRATVADTLQRLQGQPAPPAPTGGVTANPQAVDELQQELLREQMVNPPRNTGLGGQAASGFNTGLAAMVGLPVDAATSLVEGVVNSGNGNQQYIGTGYSPETGMQVAENPDYQPLNIARPVGGAEFNINAMNPVIADDAPDSAAERYAFSVGRDVGASAPFVAASLPQMGASAGRYLLTEGLSSIGSGGGEQLAEDLGGNEAVQTIAAILGGAAPVPFMRPSVPETTINDVQSGVADAYTRRDLPDPQTGQPPSLTPAQRQEVLDRVRGVSEPRTPLAARRTPATQEFLRTMDDPMAGGMPVAPTLQDVGDFRAAVRGDIIRGTADRRPEVRSGQMMLSEVDAYLREVADDPATSPELRRSIEAAIEGNDLYRRQIAAEGLAGEFGALERAVDRAATAGTGGNTVNAMRQNVRRILDSPNLRNQYTPEEVARMREIVRGTRGENALRLVSSMSPDRGGLPLMMNLAGLGGGAVMDSPLLTGGTLAAMGAGYAARQMGEGMAEQNIQRLTQAILNGRPLTSQRITDAERAVLQALLASRAGLAAQEATTQ